MSHRTLQKNMNKNAHMIAECIARNADDLDEARRLVNRSELDTFTINRGVDLAVKQGYLTQAEADAF